MGLGAYEGLVGWRYLLRDRRRPRVFLTGLAILLAGGALVGVGVYLQTRGGGELSVFGNSPGAAQGFLASGGLISAFGAALSLFGALNTFLTVFSAFGAFMITVGVATVIVVLGVMNGFQGDLRAKIIDTHAHVMVEPAETGAYIEDYRALAETVRKIDGVLGATPTLRTEVMLSAPTNLAAVALMGVDTASIGQANKMPSTLQHGCLWVLDDPSAPCRHALLDVAYRLTPPTLLQRMVFEAPELAFRLPPEQVLAPDGRKKPLRPGLRPSAEDLPPTLGGAPGEDPPADDDFGEMAFPEPKQTRPELPPAILVGAELRRNLALWPDEVLNIVSPLGELGPEGPIPKSRPFHLGGWFESGMLEFDTSLAYAGLEAVQRFMGVGDVAGALQIRVGDLEAARGVRDRVRAAVPETLRVTDWQERNRSLFSALALEKIAMFLVLTINFLLAAFAITGTLVMTTIERRREVAILMAMGSTSASIVRIFVAQGAFVGAVGSAVGATIGLSAGFALATMGLPLNTDVYYISAIPVEIRVGDVAAVLVVAMLVSVISTIYPALYASRLRPLEGLNSE